MAWIKASIQLAPDQTRVLVIDMRRQYAGDLQPEIAYIQEDGLAYIERFDHRRVSTDPPDPYTHWQYLDELPKDKA